VATNCVSVHRIYIALEPSLDGKEPTAFKAVVLSLSFAIYIGWYGQCLFLSFLFVLELWPCSLAWRSTTEV